MAALLSYKSAMDRRWREGGGLDGGGQTAGPVNAASNEVWTVVEMKMPRR